jgi:hypothetical protein
MWGRPLLFLLYTDWEIQLPRGAILAETLERGVHFDRYYGKYLVAGKTFAWLERANIYAYLAVQYGGIFAESIDRLIEKQFSGAGLAAEILGAVGTAPIDVLLKVGPRIAGDAYMKLQISQTPWADYNLYNPQEDTSEYVTFLMLSWCSPPKYKPRYHLMPKDGLGTGHH